MYASNLFIVSPYLYPYGTGKQFKLLFIFLCKQAVFNETSIIRSFILVFPTKCLYIVISDSIITRFATKKLKER